MNIWVSEATGWTGRELVRGVLEAEDPTLASAITGVVRGSDKLLFGAARRAGIAGAGAAGLGFGPRKQ